MTEPTPDIMQLFAPGTSVLNSELVIGGVSASQLAEDFGTPALIISEDALRQRARRYADELGARWANSLVMWASKSLPVTALYRVMAEEGLGVDVAGGGELVMALAAGVDPARIVLHGNAKTDDEITRALEAGVGTIVIDNFDDIDRLSHLSARAQSVLVRVTPGVEAPTHAAIATGQSDSKFGISLSEFAEAARRIEATRWLRLDGLHVHVGSQILSVSPFVEALERVAGLGAFPIYDLGGGLGARYTYTDLPPSVEKYVDALTEAARASLPAGARLMIEPGRSMVAEAGCTLYRVVSVKRTSRRTYVAVDGGMGDNLEVSLYGQRFEATVATRVGGAQTCSLVGRHCESGDQLIESIELDEPRVGDLIAVPVTGAYCLTMANNYNGALRPPIVFASQGHARAVLRRETYEDLLRRDL